MCILLAVSANFPDDPRVFNYNVFEDIFNYLKISSKEFTISSNDLKICSKELKISSNSTS